MTLGDIIQKILGLFGVAPARQRQLVARIDSVKQKIAEMEENRNTIMRANKAIGDKIAELKRQLQLETNPNNQDQLMDQVNELEKEFERKRSLAQQMGENITALRAIRAKCEQLLEQARHAADPAEVEILMEQVEGMLGERETAGMVGKLDDMGKKKRAAKDTRSEDAACAVRRAAMLGTPAPAADACRASLPSAPQTEAPVLATKFAAKAPTPAAPASPPAAPTEQGNAAAQNSLGNCYHFDLDFDENYKEAMKWNHKVADYDVIEMQEGSKLTEEILLLRLRNDERMAITKLLGNSGDDYVVWCKQIVKQDVVASTFSPSQVRKNSNLLVSVFLHTRAEVEDIKRLAREIHKDAERRGYKPLACQLKEGDRVDVSLNIYGGNKLLLSQAKSITWQGVHDSCTFRYFITEDFPMDEICCEVNLSLNNVPIGEMLFNVKIGEVEDTTPAEFGSREYNKIFISYSHDDVAKVKYIANAYRLEGKEYFFDRHYLKSGDVYPEEIKNFINTSDLFILCWSANASKSEYVRKELSQALNLAYPKIQPREKARLTIRPISIDPRADPPDEMKDIYNFEEF